MSEVLELAYEFLILSSLLCELSLQIDNQSGLMRLFLFELVLAFKLFPKLSKTLLVFRNLGLFNLHPILDLLLLGKTDSPATSSFTVGVETRDSIIQAARIRNQGSCDDVDVADSLYGHVASVKDFVIGVQRRKA